MSVVFMDDPSFYATAQMSTRYGTVGGGLSVGPNGRFGGNCWQNVSTMNTSSAMKTIGALTTGTLAVSCKFAAIPGVCQILGCYDAGTQQVDVRVDSSGRLYVTRNGTQIGSTSTPALTMNVWHRIEFKVTIDPSAGVIEVKVDGVDWIGPTSSLNTRNTANSSFNGASFGAGVGNTAVANYWNDFVVTDSNSPNADFLGDMRCYLRMPSSDSSVAWTNNWASWAASTPVVAGQQIKDGNGNVQQVVTGGTTKSGSPPTWATTGGANTTDNTVTWVVVGSGASPGAHNWMAVSETPLDGDNSYNSSATPTQVDLFGLPSLPGGATGIAAVDNVIFCRKDDAGVRTIQAEISSGGTTANSASLALSTSYQFLDQIKETDPNSSAAWTVSGANALLVGYKEIA